MAKTLDDVVAAVADGTKGVTGPMAKIQRTLEQILKAVGTIGRGAASAVRTAPPTAGTPTARRSLLRALRGTDVVLGPATPWLEVAASLARATRCLDLGLTGLVDSDEHLAPLLLASDQVARAELRERVLAPMSQLRPATADKLTETLRAWLLHHGRRDAVAEELFVHPQTVRYRVAQLREVYGDRLDDPAFVLDATLALA